MCSKQVCLHELAGRLPARTEKHRNAVVENDGQRAPEHRVRVGIASVTVHQDIEEAPLDRDTRSPVSRELLQLFAESRRLWITVETKSSSVFRSTATTPSRPATE